MRSFKALLFSSFALVAFTAGTFTASAQAIQTADLRIHVQPYALTSYVNPDFGASPTATALTIGMNLDGYHVLPYTEVGLDVRGVAARSTQINEASFTGGPRLSYRRFWVQPYAEYLVGIGRGTFNTSTNPAYEKDYSAIRSYGGGVDLRTSRYVSVRADAQYQRWRFTYLAPYFHPVQVAVGISYRLHVHSRTGPQY